MSASSRSDLVKLSETLKKSIFEISEGGTNKELQLDYLTMDGTTLVFQIGDLQGPVTSGTMILLHLESGWAIKVSLKNRSATLISQRSPSAHL